MDGLKHVIQQINDLQYLKSRPQYWTQFLGIKNQKLNRLAYNVMSRVNELESWLFGYRILQISADKCQAEINPRYLKHTLSAFTFVSQKLMDTILDTNILYPFESEITKLEFHTIKTQMKFPCKCEIYWLSDNSEEILNQIQKQGSGIFNFEVEAKSYNSEIELIYSRIHLEVKVSVKLTLPSS